MLYNRALTANTASRHINRVPALKMGRPRVAWASRWGIIAALQVAEALVVATNSCFWLAVILSSGGGDPKTAELLTFGFAVAVLVHFGLRSRGAYDFVDIMHMWRS